MKTKLFTILLLLLGSVGLAQQKAPSPEKMVLVPGNDEIDSFYIDQYEVTIADFKEFVDATGYVTEAEKRGGIMILRSGGVWELQADETWKTYAALKNRGVDNYLYEDPELANFPVMNLAPIDVFAYAKWAGKRVPTRKEWIHAAKATQQDYPYSYPGGNNLRKIAWYEGTTDSWFPKAVGTKDPNELGIYDLAGNAAELVIINSDPVEFQILGGTFYDSKMWLEIGRQLAFPVELTRPVGAIGIRLVKDVENQ
ncbi:formylglycine-generating enzyme family protein [Algoriphagus namhaensis]